MTKTIYNHNRGVHGLTRTT